MKHRWETGKWQRVINQHGPDYIFREDICKRGCGTIRRVALTNEPLCSEWIESYDNGDNTTIKAQNCEPKTKEQLSIRA